MTGLRCLERGEQGLYRNAAERDQLAAGLAHRLRERRRPAVLEHDSTAAAAPGSRALPASSRSSSPSSPDDAPSNTAKSSLPSPSKSAISYRATVAVLVLADEHQVEDADQPAVDEVHEERRGLALGLAVRKLDDQVIDRAHLLEVMGRCVFSCQGNPPFHSCCGPPSVAPLGACGNGAGMRVGVVFAPLLGFRRVGKLDNHAKAVTPRRGGSARHGGLRRRHRRRDQGRTGDRGLARCPRPRRRSRRPPARTTSRRRRARPSPATSS